MKATLFSRVPYMGSAPGGVWPVPPAAFSPEAAEQSMDAAFGCYGRDTATQRARTQPRDRKARIELGQLLVDGPETVLTQIRAIRGELDAGILDLNFLPVSRDKILRSIELFGTKVLPPMREL